MIRENILNGLARRVPFAALAGLLPRKFVIYGHLVYGNDHFVNENYRYPSLNEFDQLVGLLRRSGYEFVSLAEYLKEDMRRKILVTFDDGFYVIREALHPYMKASSLPYMIFVMTDPLTDPNFMIPSLKIAGISEEVKGRAFLSMEDILELKADGVHVGFHTRSHKKVEMNDLEHPTSREQLQIPSAFLHLFSQPLCFAYPYLAPANYFEFNEWMETNTGYSYFFDTKGFIPQEGNHFFRVSVDAERSILPKNWLVVTIKRQLIRSWFAKIKKAFR